MQNQMLIREAAVQCSQILLEEDALLEIEAPAILNAYSEIQKQSFWRYIYIFSTSSNPSTEENGGNTISRAITITCDTNEAGDAAET
ncbi:hypothetical protein KIN20_010980 [Parelaphostrongylus tenuis]|uniref:Uncharacterized protein n=1 Tax=Parelaphostrongylus tenuis TaxID=148309 RepID=A0AAD5QPI9_PARTN|nr:hypothetical protein KIN20_010980 [Parelaphostrongylus tenuis]